MAAARDAGALGHDSARRIVYRDHFKVLYERHPDDVAVNPESGKAVLKRAQEKFRPDLLRRDRYPGKGGSPNFPVQTRDGRIASSLAMSTTLAQLPVLSIDFVFADRSILKQATQWLRENRADVIQPKEGD